MYIHTPPSLPPGEIHTVYIRIYRVYLTGRKGPQVPLPLTVVLTGRVSLTFLSRKLTFLSRKLTFLSQKLTFLSRKLTFLSLKLSAPTVGGRLDLG